MQQDKKVIMYDSKEAAKEVTVKMWQSSDGRLHRDEHSARYCGCTHHKCECGKTAKVGWTKCEDCRNELAKENYSKFKFEEWDFIKPVYSNEYEKYFFCEDDLVDFMQGKNEDDDENFINEIDLLICKENHWQKVDEDYWSDNMPEDNDEDLPKEMQEALDNLNKIIDTLKPQSYSPSKIRTRYTLR